MSYDTKTLAAQTIIDAHTAGRGLEEGQSRATDLYHVLDSLLTWSDFHGVDFDATLSELRADLAEEPPCAGNVGRVVITLETGEGAREEFVSRHYTIAEAVAALDGPGIDAKARHEGRYTIAAPHGLGSDLEAVPLARKLGYQGKDCPAAAFAFLSTRIP
ncbi:hypothetical protein HOU00_gp116 [Caulobacter phage CcrPW]|uniref:Uncharacterized protein n=1 Tax=Caulobacter phage CcrPW TaxID=2283271 RepID=A0A385EE83_9CAUD|nr:hypothetical protein HOU00_gp021 [Caulobacter phage CcrPW]YP_009809639.1 hypothetical protein HOU00_gp116 [Caulobacter phage CcrPW]AXQ68560.1 hypothetical protein CcrPW_gp021 [Caulobacter phage CcrPW]AXQ69009.1 hypothetical protein CcrPW_gp470 [Caulobacter phage CcrPW]